MGGLAGHMMHPHDNLDLTFDQLGDMTMKTMYGKLKTTEKIDGFNLHILYQDGEFRVARSKGDLKVGGFTYNDLDVRFAHNPRAAEIFKTALELIPEDLYLPDFRLEQITLNCEIIIEGSTNLMWYKNAKLFVHNIWKWRRTDKGYETIGIAPWYGKIFEPQEVKVNCPVVDIKSILDEIRPKGINTIREFYQHQFVATLADMGYGDLLENYNLICLCFDRLFETKKPHIRLIKAEAGEHIDEVLEMLDNKRIVRMVKWPIEQFVLAVGNFILTHTTGYVNEGSQSKALEVFNNMFETIYPVDEDTIYHFNRMEVCDFKLNPMEGIVIEYNGHLYKWTGSFAPLNQLYGKIR